MIVFSSTLIKAVSVAYHQPQEKMLYTTIYILLCVGLSNIKAFAKPTSAVTIDKFLLTAHIKALATAIYNGSLSFN